jgi:sialidase-1
MTLLCRFICCGAILAVMPTLLAAEPFVEKIDLFKSGDGGYNLYHIPGIVVTKSGAVLAWCEARRNVSDWDDIRILLRRSTDDGQTWSEPTNIVDLPGPKSKNPAALSRKNVDPASVTYNNAVLIADRDGTVHMLFCLEYMRCFYQRSTDDGLSWSAPAEITATFEKFRPLAQWAIGRSHLALDGDGRQCASSVGDGDGF